MKRTLALLTFFLSVFFTYGQSPSKSPSSLLIGRDVAKADTESGKVRGYIYSGIYTYKGILMHSWNVLCHRLGRRFIGISLPGNLL